MSIDAYEEVDVVQHKRVIAIISKRTLRDGRVTFAVSFQRRFEQHRRTPWFFDDYLDEVAELVPLAKQRLSEAKAREEREQR